MAGRSLDAAKRPLANPETVARSAAAETEGDCDAKQKPTARPGKRREVAPDQIELKTKHVEDVNAPTGHEFQARRGGSIRLAALRAAGEKVGEGPQVRHSAERCRHSRAGLHVVDPGPLGCAHAPDGGAYPEPAARPDRPGDLPAERRGWRVRRGTGSGRRLWMCSAEYVDRKERLVGGRGRRQGGLRGGGARSHLHQHTGEQNHP